jgi:phage-related tail protein
MTVQDLYPSTTAVARRAQDAFASAADAWTENIQKVTDGVSLPSAPQIPTEVPTALFEQWFDFTDRVNKVNREYVINLAGVVNSLSTVVRDHIEGLGEAVRDQTQHVSEAVSQTAKQTVEYAAEAEQEAADKVAEAEREQARAIRTAERQRARAARKAAREKYEGLTKAELVEHLSSRDLPKTGNVDELVERLVDADTE